MKATACEGIVENGQIRLPTTVRLPESANVYVVIPEVEVLPAACLGSPRLVHPEQATDFKKVVIDDFLG